jgi:WD40 repeat protein/serine/threonine protein kinase
MSALLDCPAANTWLVLLDESFPHDQQQLYEHHLETCSVCQDRLEQTDAIENALLELGRRVGDPTVRATDPRLTRFLHLLHQTKTRESSSPREPLDLNFLRPADEPGVLGLLGDYRVQELIGQGGMGMVLKAYDPSLHRVVAIKVMAPTLAGSATARRRFTREAQAAASVNHEHVVAVHAVSEEAGLPYLVMQYVAGESLQSRLDRSGPLDLAEIVNIGLQTARGLTAAHAQGLIHRDIKPANILLASGRDAEPGAAYRTDGTDGTDGLHPSYPSHPSQKAVVKITDFGLARMVDDVALTRKGVVAGTPEYMAPEQASGEPVDHRADLFSLGSVLYTLCTGTPPFRGPSSLAVLRQVSDVAPTLIRELNPDVPSWLEAFIARLMAKDPAERLQSAAEAARLLEGYSSHIDRPETVPVPRLPSPPSEGSMDRPVLKGGRGRAPRLWLLVLLLIAVLGTGLLWRLAQANALKKEQAQTQIDSPAADIDQAIWSLTFSPDGKWLVTAGGKFGKPGQFQIWDVAAGKAVVTRRSAPGVRCVAYSPNGQLFATGHWEGDIKLRDPLTGREQATLSGHASGVNGLAFSADGDLLASVGLDRTLRIWNVAERRELQVFVGHTDMVFGVAFFHHGKAIVTSSADGTARVWEIGSDKEKYVLRGHHKPVEAVAVSPDDKVIATGSWDGTVRLWDAETGVGSTVLRQNGGGIMALSFSPGGEILVSGATDGTVHFFDVKSQTLLTSVRHHMWCVRAIMFSPDGKLLACGCEDKTATLWDVPTTRVVATLSAAGAVPTEDVEDGLPPPFGSNGWLAASALLVALFFALALAVWYFARRRRRAGQNPEYSAEKDNEENTDPPAPAISFSCSGCRKTLKARPEVAGKKIKCPQCGTPALVPAKQL